MIRRTSQEISDFFDGAHNPFLSLLWIEEKGMWELQTNLPSKKDIITLLTNFLSKAKHSEEKHVACRPRSDA